MSGQEGQIATEGNSPRPLGIQLAAASGVALAVMLVAGFAADIAIVLTTGGPPVLDPAKIGSELLRAKGSTVWMVEAWLYTLMIIAVPAFILGVYAALRREGDPGLPGLGAIAALIFWLFHTIHNLGFVTVLQVVATGYTGVGAEGSAADAVARALLGFANAAFGFGTSVGGVFLIGSMACLGVATLQNGGLPRWTGYAALAAAALALIAYLQVIVPALGPIFGIPGWLLHIAWVIGVAVALVRGRTMSTSHRFGYAPAGVTTP